MSTQLSKEQQDRIIATLESEAKRFRSEGGYYFDLQEGEPFKYMFELYKHVFDFFAENNGYEIADDLLSVLHGATVIENPTSLTRYSKEHSDNNLPTHITIDRVKFANLFFRIHEVIVFLLKLEQLEQHVFGTQQTLKHFD